MGSSWRGAVEGGTWLTNWQNSSFPTTLASKTRFAKTVRYMVAKGDVLGAILSILVDGEV